LGGNTCTNREESEYSQKHPFEKMSAVSLKNLVLAGCVVTLLGCRNSWPGNINEVVSNQYHQNYQTQKSRLEVDVSKGFSGSVFYIGSGRGFDFFKVEDTEDYFRLSAGYVEVPTTFEVGGGQPYIVPYEVFARNWKPRE
jgi:hypothetical protein